MLFENIANGAEHGNSNRIVNEPFNKYSSSTRNTLHTSDQSAIPLHQDDLNDKDEEGGAKRTVERALWNLCKGAPKVRALLRNIRSQVSTRKALLQKATANTHYL